MKERRKKTIAATTIWHLIFTVYTLRLQQWGPRHTLNEYWIWSGEHRQQMQCVFFFFVFSLSFVIFFFVFAAVLAGSRMLHIACKIVIVVYLSKVRSQFDLSHSPIACLLSAATAGSKKHRQFIRNTRTKRMKCRAFIHIFLMLCIPFDILNNLCLWIYKFCINIEREERSKGEIKPFVCPKRKTNNHIIFFIIWGIVECVSLSVSWSITPSFDYFLLLFISQRFYVLILYFGTMVYFFFPLVSLFLCVIPRHDHVQISERALAQIN